MLMRHLSGSRLPLISLLILLVTTGLSYSGTIGVLTYDITGDLVTITDCDTSAAIVDIPKQIEGASVTEIGGGAFSECAALVTIKIPSSVNRIGKAAFVNCRSLESINLPEAVTNICGFTFAGCSSLTKATLSKMTSGIGDAAFWGCGSLTDINFPDAIVSIGDGAFSGCYSIKDITIPEGVTHIGRGAFSDCHAASLSVEEGNRYYSSSSNVLFNATQTELIACVGGKLESYSVPEGITSISAEAFSGCYSMTSITLSSSVATIGDWAFRNCRRLSSMTLPVSVASIGRNAFANCTGMMFFAVEEGSQHFTSVDGVLFNADQTKLVACPRAMSGAYTIPNSVTAIGNNAFDRCTLLTDITLPEGIESIGIHSFSSCYGLTSLTLPGSLTFIDDDAFSGCMNLESAVFMGDAPSIRQPTLFFGCDKNFKVYYKAGSSGFPSRMLNSYTLVEVSRPDEETR